MGKERQSSTLFSFDAAGVVHVSRPAWWSTRGEQQPLISALNSRDWMESSVGLPLRLFFLPPNQQRSLADGQFFPVSLSFTNDHVSHSPHQSFFSPQFLCRLSLLPGCLYQAHPLRPRRHGLCNPKNPRTQSFQLPPRRFHWCLSLRQLRPPQVFRCHAGREHT